MRFYVETLGCKVNQYETQALETLLYERGHTPGSPGSGCDAVIVNTCAVTAESCRKSRQTIRRLKKLEPDAVTAVCGCFSQISPEDVRSLDVDLIGGSADRHGFVEALERVMADHTPLCRVDDAKARHIFEQLPAGSAAGRTRAMLKIQDGCQNYCAYCIIPYARGPVRSLPVEKVRAEASRLDAEGFREIVITGIEISSYGIDLPGKPALIDAIRAISEAAPNARIRLGSLEPTVVTESFCAELQKLPNVCDHFHLSLQSGCDATLKRMKRRYTTAAFYEAVYLLRRSYPDCAVTADLIVGFPGETVEEFDKTLTFIKKCEFSSMHIFPYSRRPGTLAAGMDGQLDKDLKRDRARQAGAAADEMALEYAESCIDRTLEVLFEREASGTSVGHAGNYMQVSVRKTGLKGGIYTVGITGRNGRLLLGKIMEP